MWTGEKSFRYLYQQPCILTSKLCVVSVSFNFRAVYCFDFISLLVALFISWCIFSFMFLYFFSFYFFPFFLNFPIPKLIWLELLMWQTLNSFIVHHLAIVELDDSPTHSYL